MLYAVIGSDREKTGKKVRELALSLREKRPDASFLSISGEEVSSSRMEELIGGQGLFENKLVVYFDRPFEKKANKEVFIQALPEMKTSSNIFLLLEGALDAKTKTQIEKFAEKVLSFDLPKESKEEFSLFQITDAYGARDKKRLWALYQEALKSGAEPEQIHGMLFWQVKNLLLAKKERGAKEAGLNPFVFSKASLYSKKFTEEELVSHATLLVETYHKARRGEGEFELELEQIILTHL